MPLTGGRSFMEQAMHDFKHGKLHSFGGWKTNKKGEKKAKKGAKVTSRAQAIAIGLSMERRHSGQDFNILGHQALPGGHAGYGRS